MFTVVLVALLASHDRSLFWDLLWVWLGIVIVLLLLVPWLRATNSVVRAPVGVALLVAGGGILFWGVRTFLVYVVGIGDVYRDSPLGAFIPFSVFCLLAGTFVAYHGWRLLGGKGVGLLRPRRHWSER